MTKTTKRTGSGTKQQKVEDKVDVFLEQSEMAQMTEYGYRQKIAELEAEKEVLVYEKLVAQAQKMQVDIELQRVKSDQKKSDVQKVIRQGQDYVEGLKKKYQVKADKFSYHPVTGKLILEDLINGSS